MFNKSYQIRARRRPRLDGEQLGIAFPRRGRPSRLRTLERSGQLRLNLCGKLEQTAAPAPPRETAPETFDDVLQMAFPVRPPTEEELYEEFQRLFPAH